MVDGRECFIKIIRDDGLGEDNPTFVIDQDRWRVPSDGLEGFGGVEYSISTEDYAQYDGAALKSERVPAMDRTITADSFADPAEARAEATAFFIPRRQYEVHVTYMGRTRYFVGRQYAFEVTTANVWDRASFSWTCLALEPMWLSEDEKRFDIVEAKGCFGFPFISFDEAWAPQPVTEKEEDEDQSPMNIAGFIVGVISNTIEMENGGSATAYPRFDVTATGDVVEPTISIEDQTGETVCSISLDLTLHAGDSLVLDFSARPTSVLLNGENVSHKVKPGSTLTAGIEVGDFTLNWSAESGDAALSIKPSIRERYTSV